jgi:hypothetical protein
MLIAVQVLFLSFTAAHKALKFIGAINQRILWVTSHVFELSQFKGTYLQHKFSCSG